MQKLLKRAKATRLKQLACLTLVKVKSPLASFFYDLISWKSTVYCVASMILAIEIKTGWKNSWKPFFWPWLQRPQGSSQLLKKRTSSWKEDLPIYFGVTDLLKFLKASVFYWFSRVVDYKNKDFWPKIYVFSKTLPMVLVLIIHTLL